MATESIKSESVKTEAEPKPPKEKKFKLWGSDSLTTPTKPVTPEYLKTAEFKDKVKKLWEMNEGVGWGLAANQIGWDRSVVVVEIEPIERRPEWSVVPKTVLVNPEITARSKEIQYSWEACLSCPETLMFFVPRPQWIDIKYLDENGKETKQRVEWLAATVFQHEIDHLNGRTCGEKVMVIDGEVVRGAIMTYPQWRKDPTKIPVGVRHLIKPEQTGYGSA